MSTEFGEFLEEIGAELRADMAEAAGAPADPALPSCHTVVVGGAQDLLPLLPAPGAAGVLYHAATDSVLLHHRDAGAPVYADCWHTFGGGAEPEDGGDPVAIWRRELREVLGAEVPADRVRLLFEDAVAVPGWVVHVFWAEWPARSEAFVLGEGDGFAWFSLEDALALPDLSERARVRLRRLWDRLRLDRPARRVKGAPPSRRRARRRRPPRRRTGLATSTQRLPRREAYDRAQASGSGGSRRRGSSRSADATGTPSGGRRPHPPGGLGRRRQGRPVLPAARARRDLHRPLASDGRPGAPEGAQAEVRDVLHLGLPPAFFDAVYTFNCLLHVPNTTSRRRLRRSGRCSARWVVLPRPCTGAPTRRACGPTTVTSRSASSRSTPTPPCAAVGPPSSCWSSAPSRSAGAAPAAPSGVHFQAHLLRRPPHGPAAGAGHPR